MTARGCGCEVCADLTDAAVRYGFDEALEEGLSPAELVRMERLPRQLTRRPEPPSPLGRDR